MISSLNPYCVWRQQEEEFLGELVTQAGNHGAAFFNANHEMDQGCRGTLQDLPVLVGKTNLRQLCLLLLAGGKEIRLVWYDLGGNVCPSLLWIYRKGSGRSWQTWGWELGGSTLTFLIANDIKEKFLRTCHWSSQHSEWLRVLRAAEAPDPSIYEGTLKS